MPTTLPQEQGEIPGNPNTGGIPLAEELWGKCWDFRGLGEYRVMKGTTG